MQPHRSNALRYASAASAAHRWVYSGYAAEAAVSEASGPRVSGCIRAPRYFNPYPVPRGTAAGDTLMRGGPFQYRLGAQAGLVTICS